MRIVGAGGYTKTLRAEYAESNEDVKRRVIIVGAVTADEMSEVWLQTDVSLLVSDAEGSPLSLVESMGHGCIPVVTDVSGVRRAVEHGKNGYVVPVWDINAMVQHIADLAANRDCSSAKWGDVHMMRCKGIAWRNIWNGLFP